MKKYNPKLLTEDPYFSIPLHGGCTENPIQGSYGFVMMIPGHKYKLSLHFDDKSYECIGIFKCMIRPIKLGNDKPPDPLIYVFDIIDPDGSLCEMKFARGLFNDRTIICFPTETEDYIPYPKGLKNLLN